MDIVKKQRMQKIACLFVKTLLILLYVYHESMKFEKNKVLLQEITKLRKHLYNKQKKECQLNLQIVYSELILYFRIIIATIITKGLYVNEISLLVMKQNFIIKLQIVQLKQQREKQTIVIVNVLCQIVNQMILHVLQITQTYFQAYKIIIRIAKKRFVKMNIFEYIFIIMEQNELAKLWINNPRVNQFLIMRIQEQKTQGNINQDKKITENLLLKEQMKIFLETDNKLQKLYLNPSLTQEDWNKIDKMAIDCKNRQSEWSFYLTGGSLLIYTMFLQKTRFFYNFFKKQNKFKFVNYLKKGFGIISVYVSFYGALQVYTRNDVAYRLFKQDLYQKYHINYNDINF